MSFTKENISDIYTLTPMQEGMYYFHKLDNHSMAYVQQSSIRFKGEINLSAIKESLNILFARHDILRTVFVENLADRLLQVVIKQREINFDYKDFSGEQNITEKLQQYRQEIRNIPFHLNRDILLRLGVIKTANKCYELVWTFHHIILDGWCAAIAISEFFEIYRSRISNRTLDLPKPVQFREYISWLERQQLQDSLSYWKNYLRDFDCLTSFARNTPAGSASYQKADHVEVIDTSVIAKLRQIAVTQQVTLYTVFQTVWGLLLARYNDTNDVVFGSVVSGRPSQIEGVDKILGMFINTMPVRVKFDEDQSFSELLKASQAASFQSQQHAYAPLKEIQKQHDTGRELFDHIIAFENLPLVNNSALTENGKSDFDIEFYLGGAEGQTNFDLDVSFIPGPEFIFQLSYNTQVFSQAEIKHLAERFIHILNTIAQRGDLVIREIELTSHAEKNKILGFNPPPVNRAHERLIDLFTHTVELHGDKTAVYCDDREITYAILNSLSDRVAANLFQKYNITKDSRVGLHVSRTEHLILAMLGILKTGAAFVSIDPELPANRAEKIAGLSSVNCIVTDSCDTLTNAFDQSMLADISTLQEKTDSAGNFSAPLIQGNDLAYILFTSGSTGEPKGVMIEHHSLLDYALTFRDYFSITSDDNVIMQSSISFDTMIEEIFPALMSGASVLMVPNGGKDIEAILDLIENKNATVLSTTPHVIHELNKHPNVIQHLRVLISGGDKLKPGHISKLIGKVDIYNTYGPTESTVCATYHKVNAANDAHLIGKPVTNRRVYILNKSGHIQPIGIEGELCISGEGVARGYIDDKLNTCSFRPDPFYTGERIYCTGDRARWNEDGSIEFINRNDNQVKIRGYRIEIHEIEKCISQFEGVTDVCVVANTADNFLHAYFKAQRGIHVSELRNHVIQNLPDYMVPADFMQLSQFPLLPNGKIDIKALPKLFDQSEAKSIAATPRNQAEEYLQEIWSEVLNREHLSIFDNYFTNGGDSIKSIQILAKLRKKGYKFDLRDIFHYPTIAQLAERISKIERTPVQITIKGVIPLTPIQHSFFELQNTDKHHYNHAILLSATQRLNIDGVRTILHKLSAHHDALRIIFSFQGKNIIQTNMPLDLVPEILEFNFFTDNDGQSAMHAKMDELHAGFSLENGSLLKVALFHLAEGDRLFITAHHLIIDGVSWRILLEDLHTLFEQYSNGRELDLPLKTDSYKFWAEQLKHFAVSRQLLKQVPYWGKIESEQSDDIPCDFDGQPCRAGLLNNMSLTIEPALTTTLLGKVNTVYNTQVNDVLICALGLALSEVFNITKVLISMEGHGREKISDDIDVSRTIGWFTSQYPVIIDMSEKDLSQTIRIVKETLRRIPMNGIGHSVLRYLTPPEKHTVVFRQKPTIEFNYLGQFDAGIRGDHFDDISGQPGKLLSDHIEFDKDMIVTAIVPRDTLILSIGYNTTRFSEDTMKKVLSAWKTHLHAIAAHCEKSQEKILTPSDLTDSALTMEELDTLHNLTANI